MRLIRFALASLLGLAVLLAAAPVATGGTYVVYACKTRLGLPAPSDRLTPSNTAANGAATFDNCASGGSLSASLSGAHPQPAPARAAWHYSAPPDTEIYQFDVWRWATTISAPSDGPREPAQYISFPSADFHIHGREGCNAMLCNQRGIATNEIDIRNQWYSGILPSGTREVWFGAACANSGTCEPRGSGGAPMAQIQIQAIQWVLSDGHFPSVTGVTGALAADGSHSGAESLSFTASDRGSGLYRTRIEIKRPDQSEFEVVKRAIADPNGGRCREINGFEDYDYEYGWAVPCRLSASVELEFDTTTLPDGKYQMRIRIEDAAQNATSVLPSRPFEVDNVPAGGSSGPGQTPPAPGGSDGSQEKGPDPGEPNGTHASPRARFAIRGGMRREVGHGRRSTVKVALRDENGRPIGNATVLVLQRMSVPGARWVPARTPLTTDAGGRFRYVVRPGFSRTIRFAYPARGGDESFAAKRDLTVAVRSHTSLSTDRSSLRNGEAVTFKGRLASRPVPRNGVVIDLQAQVGRRWQTFKSLRTSARGRWRASYRFRSTTGVQTYVFRARVRGDSAFPFMPSISKRTKVTVRG